MQINFIATTLFGVEAVLVRECERLGFQNIKAEDGKVCFTGDFETLCLANLWLRTAERIYVKMGEFHAETFDELFEGTKKLPWENWIPKDGEFPVNAYSQKSALYSTPDCQSIVKKAIVERLKTRHKTDWFDETGAKYKIQLGLLKDKATLMIDTSGDGLHKRGYRAASNAAPIKETLASAIIMLSYWRENKTLCDPFCGSGTFPIEAAMIGANIAPGLNRQFIAETWSGYDRAIWARCRDSAKAQINSDITLDIVGGDIDPDAVKLATSNAKIANVSNHIKFYNNDFKSFAETVSGKDYGVVICNPPYGERMGEVLQAQDIYAAMGKTFTKLPTWSFYIITSHEDFEKLYGAKASKKRKLYNGMIKCDLYQYFGEKPAKVRKLMKT